MKTTLTLLIISVASSALTQTYTVTDLGTLGSNSRGSYSEAYCINASGQISGQSSSSSRRVTDPAFLYSDGVMTALGTLGGEYASAHGINTSGQIAGYSTLARRSGPPITRGGSRPRGHMPELRQSRW